MDTPICDFVNTYAASDPLRLHMPGHKGQALLGMEHLDITEIPGADVLYQPEGIIRRSEENAASLFGTERTVYSAEGSSLSIRAMLYLAKLWAASNGKKCTIAAGRNAHKVFILASGLLDIAVHWLWPDQQESLVSCPISPSSLDAFLLEHDVTAVYITSPDYLGNLADIKGLAEVCHRYGALLLVDNAHGAYLNFLPENRHPIFLGADVCCDSAHKTLPVLTGGGYLHIAKRAPKLFSQAADRAMSLFASTSPSYLIMQSLDRCNQYLTDNYAEKLQNSLNQWSAVRTAISSFGYCLAGEEPLKITICAKAHGYTGTQLEAILEKQGIYSEFADPDFLVLMLPVEMDEATPKRVQEALLSIPKKAAVSEAAPTLQKAQAVLTPHEALFLPTEVLPISRAEGRILAAPTVSCPPAIPILVSGERIDSSAIALMGYYEAKTVTVVAEHQE